MSEKTNGVYIDKAEAEAFLEAQRKKKLRTKIITITVCVIAVLLLVFIVYKVIFGGNKGSIKFGPEYITTGTEKTLGPAIPNDAAEKLIAKSEKDGKTTELYFSPIDSLVKIKVTENGQSKEYRSWPEPIEGEETTTDKNGKVIYAKNHDIISSIVRVAYSESKMDGGKENGVNKIKGIKIKYNEIKKGSETIGFKAIYTIPTSFSKTVDPKQPQVKFEFEIGFAVEFYLDENADLLVDIPRNDIVEPNYKDYEELKEDEMPKITGITAIPYMFAARQGDSGYYVTPDGSGALTYFSTPRIDKSSEYQKRIYGYDDTFDTTMYPNLSNENISLPVYGVVQDNAMVTVFAEENEASASIVIGQPGAKELNIYYANFLYKFREYYTSLISGKNYTFSEVGIGTGDFIERFNFTIGAPEKKYSYVDVALKTREFIVDKWTKDGEKLEYLKGAKLNTSVDKKEEADLINLKIFFNDIDQASVHLFSQFKVMTTFGQAKDIISDAANENRTKIHYSLLGWQQDGYYGNIMKKYGIESAVGGKKGLTDLTSFGSEQDIDISADLNTLIFYSAPTRGATLRNSCVKDPATNYKNYKMVSNAGVYKKSENSYYMSPLFYESKLLEKDIKNLDKLGFKSVDLQQLGDLLYTDYNKENALLRTQAIEHYRKWIVEYQKVFKNVSVYYGFEYAASVADKILDIPTTSSHLFIIDESVPFVEIVYHGLVDYYSGAVNRTSDNVKSMLKSIEYGAFFTYEVTEKPTEELRYSNYNSLFKAQYSTLEADIKNAYVIASKVLEPVANSKITNHEKISSNVYLTEYDNGVKIYVNYAKAEEACPDGNVPALGVLYVANGVPTRVEVG